MRQSSTRTGRTEVELCNSRASERSEEEMRSLKRRLEVGWVRDEAGVGLTARRGQEKTRRGQNISNYA